MLWYNYLYENTIYLQTNKTQHYGKGKCSRSERWSRERVVLIKSLIYGRWKSRVWGAVAKLSWICQLIYVRHGQTVYIRPISLSFICGPQTCFCGPWRTYLLFERRSAKRQIIANIIKKMSDYSLKKDEKLLQKRKNGRKKCCSSKLPIMGPTLINNPQIYP